MGGTIGQAATHTEERCQARVSEEKNLHVTPLVKELHWLPV